MCNKLKNILRIFLLIPFTHLLVSTGWASTIGSEQNTQSTGNQASRPFAAGDAIGINTFPDTTSFLNKVFPIDGMGNIDLPIVGKVNVVKMTASEVSSFLKKNFESYLRSTNITVRPLVRVTMLGGFLRPGLYYIDKESTLWEAVRIAGGPVLDDGVYEMKWERNGKKKTRNLTPFLERGVSLSMMGFHSGDQLRTPSPDERTFWDVVSDVMPILTFTTSIIVTYYTIQQQALLMQYRR